MPRVARELSAIEVKNLTRVGAHPVGGVAGLLLVVKPTGAKSWKLRAMVGAARRDIGLGGYPSVTLAQARERARGLRMEIDAGADPVEGKRNAKRQLREKTGSSVTFEKMAREWFESQRGAYRNQKHAAQVLTSLVDYAFPYIGHLTVNEITADDCARVIEPIWSKKNETATRVRQRMERVFGLAISKGFRKHANPAQWTGVLETRFPKRSQVRRVKHFRAMDWRDVPEFFANLRRTNTVCSLALQLLILTAARSGEVRQAEWSEFNRHHNVWTIPADHTKPGRVHEVPLTPALRRFLRSLPAMQGCDLLFPNRRFKPLTSDALNRPLKHREINATVHGFRSTFRDWASENDYSRELAEQALAHHIGNQVEQAYRRSNLLEQRRIMMTKWGDYCLSKCPDIVRGDYPPEVYEQD